MAELDYAFIAEFAKVEGGKLTAIGASYISVSPASFPALHLLAIAGRIRAPEGTDGVHIEISVTLPEPGLVLGFSANLSPDENTEVYDGKMSMLFASSTMVPLSGPGLVEVNLNVDGDHARRLAFEVRAHA
ncbi:hypothetical protein AB0J48_20610 [Nocardia salmonicida]|uniref:DUF6941 family protein n=1 Tax=Nocardia salmonicida TaxID=53431 RepID=UPI003420082F